MMIVSTRANATNHSIRKMITFNIATKLTRSILLHLTCFKNVLDKLENRISDLTRN